MVIAAGLLSWWFQIPRSRYKGLSISRSLNLSGQMSEFKVDRTQKYVGMTVNERLYEAGLNEDFEIAVRNCDIEKIRKILNEVDVDQESIKLLINSMEL